MGKYRSTLRNVRKFTSIDPNTRRYAPRKHKELLQNLRIWGLEGRLEPGPKRDGLLREIDVNTARLRAKFQRHHVRTDWKTFAYLDWERAAAKFISLGCMVKLSGYQLAPNCVPPPPRRSLPAPEVLLAGGNRKANHPLMRLINFRSFFPLLITSYSRNSRRPPYAPEMMLAALMIGKLEGVRSNRELVRWLSKRPAIALDLGFRERIPTHQTFTNFEKRIGSQKFESIFSEVVRHLRNNLPGFGEVVATDATTFKAYSNWRRKPHTDRDAKTGYGGRDGKGNIVYVFGYEAHLTVDTKHELPIAVETTPANIRETTLYGKQFVKAWDLVDIHVSLADAGYDSWKNNMVTLKYRAKPVIAINPGRNHAKHHTYDGNLPIWRSSKEWKKYYDQRTAVERVNSRLKESLGLTRLYVRGLERVRTRVLLCMMALDLAALASHLEGAKSLTARARWR